MIKCMYSNVEQKTKNLKNYHYKTNSRIANIKKNSVYFMFSCINTRIY